MSRDTLAAVAAIVAVIVVILLGFHFLGSPASQRLIQSDMRTVQALSQLATRIEHLYKTSNNQIPANLDSIPDDSKRDPITRKPFLYTPKSKTTYDLCATFLAKSPDVSSPSSPQSNEERWPHPAGDHCFSLDATEPIPPAPYFN
jgi:hypothetical protein